MTLSPKKKVIVLIPTRNRPQYLHLTVKSVLEQAKRWNHNVEVVISDQSRKDIFNRNKKRMKMLSEEFGIKVHHYKYREATPVHRLLEISPEKEREAFMDLVPENGHYGAHRNFLALLAVYHGGPRAYYLHLDDDTALMDVTEDGRLKKCEHDVIGSFVKELDNALKEKYIAVIGSYKGVREGVVSYYREKISSVRQAFAIEPNRTEPAIGFARMLSFDAMTKGYLPYRPNEDVDHNVYLGIKRVDEPFVVHFGVKGVNPIRKRDPSFRTRLKWLKKNVKKEQHREIWKRLVIKMAYLSKLERRKARKREEG